MLRLFDRSGENCGLGESTNAVVRPARVRNDVANILHPGAQKNQAFKAEAETGVGDGAVTTQVQVPRLFFWHEVTFHHSAFQHVQSLLALATADEFANLGTKTSIAATVLLSSFKRM